ncbi:rod shape-determining protein [Thalassolituus alkanivorans]|uniref:rod shape-determining protein n=1 Tax=Thalassolituus alkanivorans TaxID=2881055 RepID=UPI001E2A5E0C|nr:rod shape-determining protein [Thalassolituus alkanivorans]MCB2386841.1 rod shape-determining protein [Thalassolituus alkanivorans]MCB2425000.1 rod shape-determining protein [Thalassolituus alkanivorans]
MLSAFIRSLPSGTCYAQLWSDRIRISCTQSTRVFDDQPLLAIRTENGKRIVMAVGRKAAQLYQQEQLKEQRNEQQNEKQTQDITLINPLDHPRLLIADFSYAERLLRYGIVSVYEKSILPRSPVLIIQPMEKTEGGISDIERRMYTELGLSAGARKVYVHDGAPLAHPVRAGSKELGNILRR